MLGPYRLDQKIGEGGMGSVYLATDTRLARSVAVKVVSREFAQTSEARAHFLREARAAASLSHSNIATVYDFGESSQGPWLVMKYVEGRPLLADVSGPLCESKWTRYAIEIAAALSHAHARSLIHRDIKPLNILITADDRVKIIDFGLARAIRESAAATNSITAPGVFIGTLSYSAPEVLLGGSASARSDVYSLGAVLYQMACGEQPFAGLTGDELIFAVLTGNYPACRIRNPLLAPGIEELIDVCMSREPAFRYKDGAAVLNALRDRDQAIAHSKANPARPTVAILNFRNVGGSSDLERLGTGIAETLYADLAKMNSFRVAGRNRVAQILRRLDDPHDQASVALDLVRELDACWVLTAGYQQIGKRIRFTVALLEAATGDFLVTEKIDGLRTHLFDLQDRVVSTIRDALTIRLDRSD